MTTYEKYSVGTSFFPQITHVYYLSLVQSIDMLEGRDATRWTLTGLRNGSIGTSWSSMKPTVLSAVVRWSLRKHRYLTHECISIYLTADHWKKKHFRPQMYELGGPPSSLFCVSEFALIDLHILFYCSS